MTTQQRFRFLPQTLFGWRAVALFVIGEIVTPH